jgi:hypothetical protein
MADGATDGEFEDALAAARAEGNLSRANVVRKIHQHNARPPAAGEPAAAAPDATTAAAGHERADLIAAGAAAGMSSRQIAGRLGISDQRVRELARQQHVKIPADAVLGRNHRPDASRIVQQTAHALEGLAMGVQLADPADVDPAQATEWAASLSRSIRALGRFVRQLKAVRPT